MKWVKRVAIGVAALAVLIVGVGFVYWKMAPWAPEVVMSDPGPTGRRVTDGGMVANWHPGRGAGPRPGLLLLGGSEGGIGAAVGRDALTYQRRGYSVLSLAYHRAPGTPETLELIPVEQFTRALAWLRAQPEVDPDRIGVIGGSKGAEAALLVATRDPRLKAVVAAMPTNALWPGVDWSFSGPTEPSWTEGGKPLPVLPLGKFDFSGDIRSMYAFGLAKIADHADAIIPIERARAPVLLVCGEEDTLWPSCEMARLVEARAQANGGPAVTTLAYRDAGHGVFGPPQPPGSQAFENLAAMGGTPAGNNAARADGWPRVDAFLRTNLKP